MLNRRDRTSDRLPPFPFSRHRVETHEPDGRVFFGEPVQNAIDTDGCAKETTSPEREFPLTVWPAELPDDLTGFDIRRAKSVPAKRRGSNRLALGEGDHPIGDAGFRHEVHSLSVGRQRAARPIDLSPLFDQRVLETVHRRPDRLARQPDRQSLRGLDIKQIRPRRIVSEGLPHDLARQNVYATDTTLRPKQNAVFRHQRMHRRNRPVVQLLGLGIQKRQVSLHRRRHLHSRFGNREVLVALNLQRRVLVELLGRGLLIEARR